MKGRWSSQPAAEPAEKKQSREDFAAQSYIDRVDSSTPPLLDAAFESKYGMGEKTVEFSAAVLEYVKRKHIPHALLTAEIMAEPGNEPIADPRQLSSLFICGSRQAASGLDYWLAAKNGRFFL